MPPFGFEHEAYKEQSDHLGWPPNALLVHQARINNTTPQAATLSPNLPHRTTGHPYRGLSVSVPPDGAPTRGGHVRGVGCEVPRCPARVRGYVGALQTPELP